MRREIPGPAEYAVAVATTLVLSAVGLDALQVLDTGSGAGRILQLAPGAVVALVYVVPVGLPLAVLGAGLVHLLCRRVRSQWVHVLAAGTAGLLAGLLVVRPLAASVDGIVHPTVLALVAAVSAALGRAAVVPLLPAAAAPPRTPVDDDFAGTPPRW